MATLPDQTYIMEFLQLVYEKNVFILLKKEIMKFKQMEDEGSYGNDDIRCFILSNLATAKMSKTFCVVCQNAMQIYDRYPLIDGTFFLSPKQYSKACIPVSHTRTFSHRICVAGIVL